MSKKNGYLGIFYGLIFLFSMHILAIFVLYLILIIRNSISSIDPYTALAFMVYAACSFLLWQLLYVIPVCLWLRRRKRPAMMKGVIIGAVITALLNCIGIIIAFYP